MGEGGRGGAIGVEECRQAKDVDRSEGGLYSSELRLNEPEAFFLMQMPYQCPTLGRCVREGEGE